MVTPLPATKLTLASINTFNCPFVLLFQVVVSGVGLTGFRVRFCCTGLRPVAQNGRCLEHEDSAA